MSMKKMWFLLGSFILGSSLGVSADPVKTHASTKSDTAADEAAAAQAASSEADAWAAKNKAHQKKALEEDKPSPDLPGMSPTPAAADVPPPPPVKKSADVTPPPPPPAKAAAAASVPAPAKVKRTGLNEMKGKLLSISNDPPTLRLIVEGGYNVEFTYDNKSSVVNGGDPLKIDELGYNDELTVRYAGKDLYAVEIERLSKAPRPE